MDTQEEMQIVAEYVENKMPIAKIACKYHHNSRLITRILDKYNIPHGRGELRKGQSNTACLRVLTPEEKAIVCNIYQNGGTTKQCCDAIHGNQNVVRECLKEFGLYKSHADVMKKLPQNQVKYPINEDFFFTPSANLAYVLGLMATDGYVQKTNNDAYIGLAIQDKEILDKIHELIGGRPIKIYNTNLGMSMAKWGFASKRVREELATYGIIPQKTFILKPPTKLPKEYYIDYIRGFFDGDGSINFIQQKNLRWQVCSASREMLEWIVEVLKTYGINPVNIQERAPRNENEHILYYIQYSTTATKTIYKILYTPDSLYLKRKKDAFDSYIKLKT